VDGDRGKEGKFYIMNRRNMGKFRAADDAQIVGSFYATNGFFSSPVFYKSTSGALVYIHGYGDKLKGFRLANGTFSSNPIMAADTVRWPGGGLSVSANGANGNSAVVWSLGLKNGSADAVLRAYNALDLKTLWVSDAKAADEIGAGTKFAVPTVANGKVYVPTDGKLVVYGLKK
jgi:hypothetical protein